MTFLVSFLDVVLLVATLGTAVSAAFQRRERRRVDVALFMAAFGFSQWVPSFFPLAGVWRFGLAGLYPYLTLRLVNHFRRVPAWAWTAAGAIAVMALVGGAVYGISPAPDFLLGLKLSSGFVLTYGAAAMSVDARRSVGVRARRLMFVAAGTMCFGFSDFLSAWIQFQALGAQRDWLGPFRYLDLFTILCYYLSFCTPRFLTTRWRRAEQATYLTQASEREPEERGRRAADDLVDGANRCVGGSLAFVALRSPEGDLSVDAASQPHLAGLVIAHGPGLLNRVLATRVAEVSYPSACEPEIESVVAESGVMVLVAPVVASGRAWGVVVAVHRRGALFPEDDVSMLAQLGRNAATALDHAALVLERRERAQQDSSRRLRELESRVGLMLDSIKDYAMLVVDQAGAVAAWHTGAQLVFGHSRDQIARQSGASLFGLEEDTFAEWLDESAAKGVVEREGTCRRFDGRTFTGVTTIRPLVPEAGTPPGFVVVTQDVTERRSLEERLRQGQKMQAIGQLAGGVAHDFNNLLTAILGYADWLEQGLAGDPRLEQVTEIQRAAERAADLTRRLLAFSRKQMVQPSKIDLARLVSDLLPMLRRLIGDRIEIVDESSPLASPVMGDRSQIEQVILNLVLNARDAIPDGGRITIRAVDVWRSENEGEGPASLPGPYLMLEVADTGTGMDAETRRRAFEPFFTTKDVGRGTGLGLATVYGIVQQMDGVVEVESELGQGATFRVYLPHALAASVASGGESVSELTGRETVLLVEDDPALRPYLVQVLERNGYRVIAAENSEVALQVTDSVQYPIDLVISDVTMPGRSGPELVAELLRSRPGLPALYISGHAEGLLPGGTEALERRYLLQKPFSSTDFLAKVRQILAAA